MKVTGRNGKTSITLDEKTLRFTIDADGSSWTSDSSFTPAFLTGETVHPFTEAKSIRHEEVKSGVGVGIRSSFGGFKPDVAFETCIWIEDATENVFFEWIPLRESCGAISAVEWPSPMEFAGMHKDWYTLLTTCQGLLVPNTQENEIGKIAFDGQYLTEGSYMPWFGQVREGEGYIAIALTPWNGKMQAKHPQGGGFTSVYTRWEPDLDKMRDRRIMRYSFRKDCDYNTLCKIYRSYVMENGLASTLEEKSCRLPSVNDLIGCAFVHCGIKTNVNPKSSFYDPENPDKNNHMTPFSYREAEVRKYHSYGVKKLYLHLDGWAQPGYDNQHPDYLPACKEAGGWEGMKSLADTMHECGYLFGIHDQYRDYYLDAPSFDEDFATRLPDGTIPQHARWAGGPQSYLCATQAQYYVRRNFQEIARNGVKLDGAYLDVFTCNEGDECANPRHRMSRRECYTYRGQCFDWLIAHGILPSSEETSDWSMRSLVFCHYAPYSFMLAAPGTPRNGIPTPLFNLVYHDCVIEPWMMEKTETEDLMLYALINGGAPYLVRDGAYAGMDGAFDNQNDAFAESVRCCKIVSDLHEKVAKKELLSHRFLDEEGRIQESIFAGGIKVHVDFNTGSYEITEE